MSEPAHLDDYAAVVGAERVALLRRLAAPLQGLRVVVVNSTKQGGGVAEMLHRHVPLLCELGLDVRWEVMEGFPEFFAATKTIHNAVQGDRAGLSPAMQEAYVEANRRNAERIDLDADVVIIHDPQPAGMIDFVDKRVPWIWRCHIDAARPNRQVWRFLRKYVERYEASVFSMPAFAQALAHRQYVIHPSIDPLTAKNEDLDADEVAHVLARFGIEQDGPLVVQVSRFDRFKDPVGVIRAFRLARRREHMRLVLLGGGADDDPEGSAVLQEVLSEAANDPDIFVLSLSPDSHHEVNAFQRAATVVVQKSLREGFGLTVTEGLWKARPVLGGAVGGITLQVFDHHTGFLVHSIEGLSYRIRYLLNRPELAAAMGRAGRTLVRHDFLLTRHLRDWLVLLLTETGRASAVAL